MNGLLDTYTLSTTSTNAFTLSVEHFIINGLQNISITLITPFTLLVMAP